MRTVLFDVRNVLLDLDDNDVEELAQVGNMVCYSSEIAANRRGRGHIQSSPDVLLLDSLVLRKSFDLNRIDL